MSESQPIRELPAQASRVETGPTRFGDDWCGLFIRGDNAFAYSLAVEATLMWLPADAVILKSQMTNLLQDLQSCDERRRR